MRIEEELKLDYSDVLFRPKRSTLKSRKDVNLLRTYRFKYSKNEWSGIPIMAANMDGVGELSIAEKLNEYQMITCLTKQHDVKKIKENKWHIFDDNEEKEIPIQFFEKNREIFKFNGGDMENLWSLTKIAHARRVFGKSNTIIKKITKEDLENGLKLYQENDEVKNRDKELKKYLLNTMYC